MSETLSEIVERKMKKENLSLRKAAAKAGVAHTTIDRILKQESVEFETLKKVSDWVGIPVSSILDTGNEKFEVMEEIAKLFAMNPEFSQVFSEIAEKIKIGDLDANILAEITGFASYRMHEKMKNKQKR